VSFYIEELDSDKENFPNSNYFLLNYWLTQPNFPLNHIPENVKIFGFITGNKPRKKRFRIIQKISTGSFSIVKLSIFL